MLRKVLKIAGREFTGFFASPAAFLFLAAFLGVTLFVFFWIARFFARDIADVRPLFQWMPVLLIFLVAALTMRAWAEERRSGTLELLLTSPTGLTEHVLGKFLGSMGLVLVALALTLPLPITVSLIGPLDWGPVIGGYVAAVLLASAYVAIGLWVSCRTDNQIVSLILTALIAGVFYLIGSGPVTSLFGYQIGDWLRALGAGSRFSSITRGVLDLRDLYYYLSIAITFLALNRLALEKLRWAHNSAQPRHRHWYLVAALLAANALGANLWLGQIRTARLDLTAGHLYTLSDTTRNYLGELQEPLLIRGYFSSKTHPLLAPLVPQLRNLLEEYAVAGGSKVRVQFVDPDTDPAAASQAASRYDIQPVPFEVSSRYQSSVVNSYFDVLVAYGNQYQVLNFQDLIGVKQRSETNLSVELRDPEYEITNAIRKVLLAYQGGGSVFDTLKRPVTLTGYISGPGVLPKQLQAARSALSGAIAKLSGQAHGKFRAQFRDPGTDPALATRIEHSYGFHPMVLGLLATKPFWFYLTLGDGQQTESVPLPAKLDEATFESALKAGIKRFSPGFLKTVAVLTSPNAQITFQRLRQTLNNSVHWLPTNLKSGHVPDQADMLMVLGPQGLDTRQVFAIDQFLMQGGTVMVASSPTQVTVARTLSAAPYGSGLSGWLKHFGLKLGNGLVLDTRSGALPIPVNRNVGGITIRELELARYPYIVDVRGAGLNQRSPITSNLGQLDVPWAAPITVNPAVVKGLKVTDLLRSSADSWVSNSTDVLPNYQTYPQLGFPQSRHTGSQLLAVMLQGRFDSAFAGKASPLLAAAPTAGGAAASRAPKTSKDPPAAKQSAAQALRARERRLAHRSAATTGKGTAKTRKPAPLAIGSVIQHSPSSARLILVGSDAMFTDAASGLINEAQGQLYRKPEEFVENLVDWALQDQGLASIRGRDRFARTLTPMAARTEEFWEYGNYLVALGGLLLVWVLNRRRRHRLLERHLRLLREV